MAASSQPGPTSPTEAAQSQPEPRHWREISPRLIGLSTASQFVSRFKTRSCPGHGSVCNRRHCLQCKQGTLQCLELPIDQLTIDHSGLPKAASQRIITMATRRQGQRVMSMLRNGTRQSSRGHCAGTTRMFTSNQNPAAKRPGVTTWLTAAAIGFAVPLAYQLYSSV